MSAENMLQHIKNVIIKILTKYYIVVFYIKYKRLSNEIFDYKKIVSAHFEPKLPCNYSLLLYGIRRILQLAGFTVSTDTEIEHGVYFGKFVKLKYHSLISKVVTMNYERSNLLSPNYDVVTTGPYIYYAKSLLKKSKTLELKHQLGKTLLVFPVHSIPGVKGVFDEKHFIQQLNEIALGYQNIYVCLYYDDINRGADISYLEAGYRVVSAGSRLDPFFLNRLRTFFELADACLTNGLGTHVGYSILLDKPVIFISQKVVYDGIKEERLLAHTESDYEKWILEYKLVQKEFKEIFNHRPTITDAQKKFCAVYWGYNYLNEK